MPPIPAPHADHDPLAIAAYAAGDAEGPELDAALALVAACADCAALHHDLRSIAAALPDLPAPVRSRDFRLAPGQAATLRPAGWRRVLAPFAGPRFAFAGPLGTGLATLGIAGLLVAGAAAMPLGGASVAPVDTASGQGADGGSPALLAPAPQAAESAAPEMAPAPGSEGPAASSVAGGPPRNGVVITGSDPNASGLSGNAPIDSGTEIPQGGSVRGYGQVAPSGEPKAYGDSQALTAGDRDDGTAPEPADATQRSFPANAPVLVLAAALLAAGLVVGGLRLVARRVT